MHMSEVLEPVSTNCCVALHTIDFLYRLKQNLKIDQFRQPYPCSAGVQALEIISVYHQDPPSEEFVLKIDFRPVMI